MIWLAWRLHRVQLAAFVVVFLALACLFAGAELAGYGAARVWGTDGFSDVAVLVRTVDRVNGSFFAPLPLLVGVFVGAPLLADEIERNTVRYAWTQGVSKASWLWTKIALVCGPVLVACLLFSLARMWWYFPLDVTRHSFGSFHQGPFVLLASVLFAFALGLATGAMWRSTPAAMATTIVGHLVVVAAFAKWLRPDQRHPAEFWSCQIVGAAIYLGMAVFLLVTTFWWILRKALS